MGFLDRLRALLGGGASRTERDDRVENRILSSPDQVDQQALAGEGQREALADEGERPAEPDR